MEFDDGVACGMAMGGSKGLRATVPRCYYYVLYNKISAPRGRAQLIFFCAGRQGLGPKFRWFNKMKVAHSLLLDRVRCY